jgi:type I restriction enzyme S subunit
MADVYRRISHGIRPSQWRREPEHFEKRVIFLLPFSEQAQICTFIDVEYRRIEHLIAQVQKLISYLGEYRTALISTAVTGTIDVRGEVA